jgi:formylmethanofuran dehydrogenase subunit E
MCPGLALGYRVATAALTALGCERPRDEELVAVVENDSCAVDAIQFVCGCTFGKGNLVFRDHGKHVYTFYDRNRGRGVRVSEDYTGFEEDPDLGPLREAVASGEATQEQQEAYRAKMRAKIAAILSAPAEQLLRITEVTGPPPPKARIEPSERCAECGEPTMASRLVDVSGRKLCRECAARAG